MTFGWINIILMLASTFVYGFAIGSRKYKLWFVGLALYFIGLAVLFLNIGLYPSVYSEAFRVGPMLWVWGFFVSAGLMILVYLSG